MRNLIRGMAFCLVSIGILSCGKNGNLSVSIDASPENATVDVDKVTIQVQISAPDVEIENRGLIFSVQENSELELYDYDNSVILSHLGENTFTVDVFDLKDNTTYYYRGFSVIDGYAYYGEKEAIHTDCFGLGCGPAGGQIVYLDGEGGGIEVAIEDVVADSWGCSGDLIPGIEDTFGSGLANTNAIIANCAETNILALECANYTYNGYDDWYMPSVDELLFIYEELDVNGWGNFYGGYYYSSSQFSGAGCKAVSFSGGSVWTFNKNDGDRTRPIRTF